MSGFMLSSCRWYLALISRHLIQLVTLFYYFFIILQVNTDYGSFSVILKNQRSCKPFLMPFVIAHRLQQ